MKKPTLEIYADDKLKGDIDSWRATQRPILSRAAAARELIKIALTFISFKA